MAQEKFHPNRGSTNGSRWDKRAVVKVGANLARRRQDAASVAAGLADYFEADLAPYAVSTDDYDFDAVMDFLVYG